MPVINIPSRIYGLIFFRVFCRSCLLGRPFVCWFATSLDASCLNYTSFDPLAGPLGVNGSDATGLDFNARVDFIKGRAESA